VALVSGIRPATNMRVQVAAAAAAAIRMPLMAPTIRAQSLGPLARFGVRILFTVSLTCSGYRHYFGPRFDCGLISDEILQSLTEIACYFGILLPLHRPLCLCSHIAIPHKGLCADEQTWLGIRMRACLLEFI